MENTSRTIIPAALIGLSALVTGCVDNASRSPSTQSIEPTSSIQDGKYHLDREAKSQVNVTTQDDLAHRIVKHKIGDEFVYTRLIPTNHELFNAYITNLSANPTNPAIVTTNLTPALDQLDVYPLLFNRVTNTTELYPESASRKIDLETTGLTYMPQRLTINGKPVVKFDLESTGPYAVRAPERKMPTHTNGIVEVVQTEKDIPFNQQRLTYNFQERDGRTNELGFYAVRFMESCPEQLGFLFLVRTNALKTQDNKQYRQATRGIHPDGTMDLRGEIYQLNGLSSVSNDVFRLQQEAYLKNLQVLSNASNATYTMPQGLTGGQVKTNSLRTQ